MNTIFKIGSKSHALKYQRKMSEGEVNKMKSFITSKDEKLQKTNLQATRLSTGGSSVGYLVFFGFS